ncbi:MAG: UvrD-helicase domain-containing protein [Microthrixaceae bacterium]
MVDRSPPATPTLLDAIPSPSLVLDEGLDDVGANRGPGSGRRSARPSGTLTPTLVAGLNAQQHTAVMADAAVLRILAGAGSGKTRVLTRRIARRIDTDGLDPRRVLAVTFTRKAASELRQRIGALGIRGSVTAGTFHAVAFTQLRQRWQERGITPPELLSRKVPLVARHVRSRKGSTLALDVVAEIEWAKARMISAAD